MDKLMVIDGSALVFRAFYALPPLSTKSGIYTNAIYGFVQMMENAIAEYDPDYLVVCFDKPGGTFRNEIYEEYKGTREKTPPDLSQQLPILRDILAAMNIPILESDEYEADDIAGTLSKKAEELGMETLLLTGDKDYLQLVDEHSKVVLTRKGITQLDSYDVERIKEEYELTPEQLIDLKGLMGDSSDNIPGVPGVGEKTGLKLLKQFNTMEGVYENLEEVSGKKLKENLTTYKDQAFMSKELGKIVTDVPLDAEIEDLKRKEYDYDTLVGLYRQYEFNQLMKRLPQEVTQIEETVKEDLEWTWLEDDWDALDGADRLYFKAFYDEHLPRRGKIIAVALGTEDDIYLSQLDDGILPEALKKILREKEIVGHEIKDTMVMLRDQDVVIEHLIFDTMVAAYLLDPSRSDYSIGNLMEQYFGIHGVDEENLLGKGKKKKSYLDIEKDALAEYMANEVYGLTKVWKEQQRELEELDMQDLFVDIELPLITVLADMEYTGIAVDREVLEELGETFTEELEGIEERIYNHADMEFNINSPKQLGEVLFEKLQLPVIKRTKTGYSTDAEVLDKLQNQHEIIDEILRYRQLKKLMSTYIDGLLELINPETGRIHSRFRQTITATGRLSSTDPNLQNIPIRTEEGRLIRKAFVAKEDCQLVDADYSQIELRVLAHVSGDETMANAFKEGQDIHATTASQVFHTAIDDVTPDQRSRAKAVNFGIVYGISDYGLSQDLNISRKEAGSYIERYLEHFPKVDEFMDQIVAYGKEHGYVETIFHRRRYIPELESKNYNVRSFGERVALNMPIQGSAADIIKIAMNNIYRVLKEKGLKSRLILQVHDELILETYEDELEEVKALLRQCMEEAAELSIPLQVDLEVGKDWYHVQG